LFSQGRATMSRLFLIVFTDFTRRVDYLSLSVVGMRALFLPVCNAMLFTCLLSACLPAFCFLLFRSHSFTSTNRFSQTEFWL
jgi:hypothetical protein